MKKTSRKAGGPRSKPAKTKGRFAQLEEDLARAKAKLAEVESRSQLRDAWWQRNKMLAPHLDKWTAMRSLPRGDLLGDPWIRWVCRALNELADALEPSIAARGDSCGPLHEDARRDLHYAAHKVLRLAHQNPSPSTAELFPLPAPIERPL